MENVPHAMDKLAHLPDHLRRKLIAALGAHLSRLLDAQGVRNRDIEEDFRDHRRYRR